MLTSGSFKRPAIVQVVGHVPWTEAGSALLHPPTAATRLKGVPDL